MRYLLALTVLLAMAVPAYATQITEDGARAFYNSCKNKPDPNMSGKTQDELCACSAAHMFKYMTVEDVKAMSQQNEAGRIATNKMIVNVYAPCMKFPAKELYYKNCISNPQTATMVKKDPEAVCQCMSTKVADYLSEDGPDVFSQILMRNPTITDPMAALSEDKEFQSFAQKQLFSCL